MRVLRPRLDRATRAAKSVATADPRRTPTQMKRVRRWQHRDLGLSGNKKLASTIAHCNS